MSTVQTWWSPCRGPDICTATLRSAPSQRRWTYAELYTWVNRLAHGLAGRGYSRVAEAVVVGLPHDRWSEPITAVVVPKPGETIDEAALIAAVKERLDGYKVPKSVIVATDLPRTSTGKIQKNVIRIAHADHYTPTP